MQHKFDISLILPAIRQDNWDRLYESASLACKRFSFEMIFCGPLPLTPKLQAATNVKYVKDLGSPTRAQNIAGMLAEGKFISWIADDGVLLEDSFDKNIDILIGMGPSHKNIVSAKYFEGKDGTEKPVLPDSYFYLGNTIVTQTYVPPFWLMCNSPVLYTQFYNELGGLDPSFEVCPIAHIDFGIRAMHAGATIILSQIPFIDVNHMGHGEGDHAAVEVGQLQYDQPKIRERYLNPQWHTVSPFLSIYAWKNTPAIWTRRFKNGVPKDYKQILEENPLSYNP